MHNNYYFLRHLTRELEVKLSGAVISECFSQHKEELIVRFETRDKPFFIKASLLPSFSCLSFPENFQRARKNSVDLFEKLIGQRLISIRQYINERSFAILLSNGFSLLFKMHGNRSNIILFENGDFDELFKNSLVADRSMNPQALDREIDWSFEKFQLSLDKLPSLYFTFGKIVWRYLEETGFHTKDVREKWNMIQEVRLKLENKSFYITQFESTPLLSLLAIGNILKTFSEAIPAVNEYYYTYTQVFALQKEKASARSILQTELNSSKNYYDKTKAKLHEIEAESSYRIWADLIMANLHNIAPSSEKVMLDNFYNENCPVEIKLKKDLSPQKNAEVYYRKAKNQQIEIDRLTNALLIKEKDIEKIAQQLEQLEDTHDLKSVRKLADELAPDQEQRKTSAPLPYHEFSHGGYRIWVGKNAQSNDILTFRLGYKEDLWLHAKDVSGSHVLVKHQAGKNFPKDVIERAAQLAAYNSKRKNETLCPIIVTPRKYVRKRKGDPAGAVVVDREDVIMVEPRL